MQLTCCIRRGGQHICGALLRGKGRACRPVGRCMGEIDVAAKHHDRLRGGTIFVGLIGLHLPRLSQPDRPGRTRARRCGSWRRQRRGPRRRGRRMGRRGDRGCGRRSGGSRRRRRDHAAPTNGTGTSRLPTRWRISAAPGAVARASVKTSSARSGGRPGASLSEALGGDPDPQGKKDRSARVDVIVEVTVRSTGQPCSRRFQLINNAGTPRNAFRLEPE
jgi:hypothetical protein